MAIEGIIDPADGVYEKAMEVIFSV
jgi:hypothetical protein